MVQTSFMLIKTYLSIYYLSTVSCSLMFELWINSHVFYVMSFQMAPTKKGEKKKGRSAINEVVTREYTINIHKRIHGM